MMILLLLLKHELFLLLPPLSMQWMTQIDVEFVSARKDKVRYDKMR